MSAMQQPTANHQSETFGSCQTQYFECEALSADHPEIQARERARQQRLQLSNPTQKQARPAPDSEAEKSTQHLMVVYAAAAAEMAMYEALGVSATQAGDQETALAMLNESLAIQERDEDKHELIPVLDNLGYVTAAAGEMDTARAYFARAIKLAGDLHKLPSTLDIILGWTATLTRADQTEQAIAMITFAGEHASAWLETRDRAERWLCDRAVGLLPDAVEAAKARGRGLDYDEVVKEVIGKW